MDIIPLVGSQFILRAIHAINSGINQSRSKVIPIKIKTPISISKWDNAIFIGCYTATLKNKIYENTPFLWAFFLKLKLNRRYMILLYLNLLIPTFPLASKDN